MARVDRGRAVTDRLDARDRWRLLLSLLPWLTAERGAPLDEVASRAGIPIGEVVELLELAACCGLPPYSPDQLLELIVFEDRVEARPGPHLTRPVRLSADEGFEVAAAARAILAVQGGDPSGSLARALRKLETVLGDRVAVDLDDPEHLDDIRRAVDEGQRIELEYYSASRDELTRRRVDPLTVYSMDGHWYLDGYCYLAAGLRHFRVDRVVSVQPTGEPSDPPGEVGGPDVGERGAKGPGQGSVFVAGPGTRTVKILVPPSGNWLIDALPTLEVEKRSDGRSEVTLEVGGTAWLERLLLQLGPEAEVVEPAELARVGPEAAARVLARYR